MFLVKEVVECVDAPDSLTFAIRQWVQDFIAAIKVAVLHYLRLQIGRVTGAKLNAIARAYADYVTLADRGRGTVEGDAFASREGYEGKIRGEAAE